jgi:hypothetical protein
MAVFALAADEASALSDAIADRDDAYPTTVAIKFRKRLTCTGTVLYPRIVVTAAHCVTKVVDAKARLFADETILASQTTIAVTTNGKTKIVPVSEIILSPEWRKAVDKPSSLQRYAYDIALLVTAEPIDVPLPASFFSPGAASTDQAIVVGFGADNCSADARCGHAGVRRSRQVQLKEAASCFNELIELRDPSGAKIDGVLARNLDQAVWCFDWGVMPGDSGGTLLVQGKDGIQHFAGVISSHWGSYAAHITKQEAEKRSFASSLAPSLRFIEQEAKRLGMAP